MERFAFDTRGVNHTDAISYWAYEVLPQLDSGTGGRRQSGFLVQDSWSKGEWPCLRGRRAFELFRLLV